MIFDIKSAAHQVGSLRICEMSPLWMSLRTSLSEHLKSEEYEEAARILSISRSLSSWLSENSIFRATLYDDCDTLAIMRLCERPEKINSRAVRLIFQCLVDLMAHNEADRLQIQRILSLPWSQEPLGSAEGTRRLFAIAKSLDVDMKTKAIRAISEFGKGRDRVNILSACLSRSEIELSVAAVSYVNSLCLSLFSLFYYLFIP